MAVDGFLIPDAPGVAHARQAGWMGTDVDALVAGFARTGVVSGCEVTAQGTPNMTLAVAAGVVVIGGVLVSVAAGNVTVTTAHATLDRIDLVVVNASGTKSVTAGTAASSTTVVAPAVPASSALLRMVYVPAAATAITNSEHTDKRVLLDVVVPTVHLYRSSAHPIANNTGTDIPWNAEERDDSGWHDLVTNPTRITVTKSGLYLATATVAWELDGDGFRDVWFAKNNSGFFGRNRQLGDAVYNVYQSYSQQFRMAATDYLTVRVQHDAGNEIDVLGDETRVQLTYLGPIP